VSTGVERSSNPIIGTSIGRRIMKRFVQNSVAVFVMLTLTVVYARAQQLAVTATETVSGYVLGPHDQFVIRAIDAAEISDKPVLIGTNGNITLPMVGRVQAGGLTVEQLEAELTIQLNAFVQEPQISVTVTEVRSHQYRSSVQSRNPV
jgi:protein involved in polysaccharide export with SLBB domain